MYNITVIGAGVSGLTTANLCQLFGHRCKIISKDLMGESNLSLSPKFSSLTPAASIIPHSIYGDDLLNLFTDSDLIFKHLLNIQNSGVITHQHYEIFEEERTVYDYVSKMDGAELLDEFKTESFPHLPDREVKSGWRYYCRFADWNIYPQFLKDLFLKNGGLIEQKNLNADDIKAIESDIVINCSGLSSIDLFGDTNNEVYLGHTILIPEEVNLSNGEFPVSYNYEPKEDLYPSVNGVKQDVYTYSRKGELLLGGSRIPGKLINGKFVPDQPVQNLVKTEGESVPKAIYNLNKAIFKQFFDTDLDRFDSKIGRGAYRFIRNKEQGLRIEAEERGKQLILHNYGNGGAGVTISWGAAIKVFNLIADKTGKKRISPHELIQKLS